MEERMSKYFIPAIVVFVLAVGAFGAYKHFTAEQKIVKQEITIVTDKDGNVVAAASSVAEEPVVEEVQPEEASVKPIE